MVNQQKKCFAARCPPTSHDSDAKYFLLPAPLTQALRISRNYRAGERAWATLSTSPKARSFSEILNGNPEITSFILYRAFIHLKKQPITVFRGGARPERIPSGEISNVKSVSVQRSGKGRVLIVSSQPTPQLHSTFLRTRRIKAKV